jgi:hypothetical protein
MNYSPNSALASNQPKRQIIDIMNFQSLGKQFGSGSLTGQINDGIFMSIVGQAQPADRL